MNNPFNRKHGYIITSERAMFRNDEFQSTLYSDKEYHEGETIVLDGLCWDVDEVLF